MYHQYNDYRKIEIILFYTHCAIGAIKGELVQYQYLERESKTVEFKSQLPTFLTLVKTCVAFANGIGGQIIIGVDDKTHQLD